MKATALVCLATVSLTLAACKDRPPDPEPVDEVYGDMAVITGNPKEGTGYCIGTSVATDRQGNIYVAGYYLSGQSFGPVALDGAPHYPLGYMGVFMAKYSPQGEVVWARNVGTVNDNSGYVPGHKYSMALDGAGDLVIAGKMGPAAGFDPSKVSGDGNVYLAKYDSDGRLKWARAAARGAKEFAAYGVAVDPQKNITVTGTFRGEVGFGGVTLRSSSSGPGGSASGDIFLARLDAAGVFVWARSAGGGGRDLGQAVAVDGLGNAYVTGSYEKEAHFGPGSSLVRKTGIHGTFVAKYDGGGIVQWVRETDLDRQAEDIGVDKAGNVFALSDQQVVKLDNGGRPLWNKRFDMKAKSLAVGNNGELYLAGTFTTPVELDGIGLTPAGEANASFYPEDIFVARMGGDGRLLSFMRDGGEGSETPGAIAVGGNGNVYLTGEIDAPRLYRKGPEFAAVLANREFKGLGARAFVLRYRALHR